MENYDPQYMDFLLVSFRHSKPIAFPGKYHCFEVMGWLINYQISFRVVSQNSVINVFIECTAQDFQGIKQRMCSELELEGAMML